MARPKQIIAVKTKIVKKLLLIICIAIAAGATAQRDINHWQLSALGGGYYFNETLSNTLEDIDEPGFYTLGLRIQKKLGTDFQVGLSFLENRLTDDFDISVRATELSLAYNWDNGYLLSQRAAVSPYHLIGAGFRSRGKGDEVNFESTKGLLSLENGIKVRLGDNWSTHVAFVLNWNSEDEQFKNVFDRGYNYGAQVGISYHFGQVHTKYQGPIFNAGRDYMGSGDPYTDFAMGYTYLALDGQSAAKLSGAPQVTTDGLVAMRNMTFVSSKGRTVTIAKNDSVFQLIAAATFLDSLYANRNDVFRLSADGLKKLKSEALAESRPSQKKAKQSKDSEEFIDKQNRLIENQNDFIQLMLASKSLENRNAPAVRRYYPSDSSYVDNGKNGSQSANRAENRGNNSVEDYSTQDSLALIRVTKVDSAHVYQKKEPQEDVSPRNNYSNPSADSTQMMQMENRLEELERENEMLRDSSQQRYDQLEKMESGATQSSLATDTVQMKRMEDQLNDLERENRMLRDSSQQRSNQSSEKMESGAAKSSLARDTAFVANQQESKELSEMEDRLSKLEEENKKLKESSESKQQNSERNEQQSTGNNSNDELTGEAKRRNDLLEKQIDATQKLAEENSKPDQIVIEDNRRRDKGVTVQPAVSVPLNGGNGSGKNDEEILQNQQEMQARLDSLSRVISDLKTTDSTPTSTTPAETTYQRRNNNVLVAGGVSTMADSSRNDSTDVENMAMDTTAVDENIMTVDSLLEIGSTNVKDDFVMSKELLTNPDLDSALSEKVDSLATAKNAHITTESSKPTAPEEAEAKPGMVYPVSVYFGLNSSSLSAEDQAKLKGVAADLEKLTNGKITLEGHTDKSGNAAYNEVLSKKRADAVKGYLVENGVATLRISLLPLGSKEANQAYNEDSRRVDITLE
jgi:outer membrane protein OmpA-like peptidoglycan-associated protein